MSRKPDNVGDALLASLSNIPTKKDAPAAKPKAPARAKPSAQAKPRKPVRQAIDDPIVRATVSIRASDSELADDLIAVLKGQGVRASFSDAVKIALRLCPQDTAAIVEAFAQVKAGDRRGKA